MYRNSYQRGMLTVLYSVGSKPLGLWGVKTTPDGYITRFLDQDIKSMVVELGATNVSTTYIYCPKFIKVSLGISMPFLVMIVKNLRKYFSFEITILDETGTRRRFRASNFQSTTQITPMCTVIPISLSDGWNQIQFNLADFTHRAYNKQFVEVQRVKINANIRIRRVYFTERLLPEDELPAEYKLFFPLQSKKTKHIIQKERKQKEGPTTEDIKEPLKEEKSPEKVIEGLEEKEQEGAVAAVDDMMDDLVDTQTKEAKGMVTPASEVVPDEPTGEAQEAEETGDKLTEEVAVEETTVEGVKDEEIKTEGDVPLQPEVARSTEVLEAAGEVMPDEVKEEVAGETTASEETQLVGAGEATENAAEAEIKEEVPAEVVTEPEPEPEVEVKTDPVEEEDNKVTNEATEA